MSATNRTVERDKLLYDWQQKPWGWTKPLYLSSDFELWTAHCLAGGYSSTHWHDLKHNIIYSRDATLLITFAEPVRQTLVGPLQAIDIKAGIEHRFEVISSGRIYETYYGVCHPQDIVRRDTNGWRPPRSLEALGLSVPLPAALHPYRLDR